MTKNAFQKNRQSLLRNSFSVVPCTGLRLRWSCSRIHKIKIQHQDCQSWGTIHRSFRHFWFYFEHVVSPRAVNSDDSVRQLRGPRKINPCLVKNDVRLSEMHALVWRIHSQVFEKNVKTRDLILMEYCSDR